MVCLAYHFGDFFSLHFDAFLAFSTLFNITFSLILKFVTFIFVSF